MSLLQPDLSIHRTFRRWASIKAPKYRLFSGFFAVGFVCLDRHANFKWGVHGTDQDVVVSNFLPSGCFFVCLFAFFVFCLWVLGVFLARIRRVSVAAGQHVSTHPIYFTVDAKNTDLSSTKVKVWLDAGRGRGRGLTDWLACLWQVLAREATCRQRQHCGLATALASTESTRHAFSAANKRTSVTVRFTSHNNYDTAYFGCHGGHCRRVDHIYPNVLSCLILYL